MGADDIQKQIHHLDLQIQRLVSHAESESGLAGIRNENILESLKKIDAALVTCSARLDSLENWRSMIIGGSIASWGILGFLWHKIEAIPLTISK